MSSSFTYVRRKLRALRIFISFSGTTPETRTSSDPLSTSEASRSPCRNTRRMESLWKDAKDKFPIGEDVSKWIPNISHHEPSVYPLPLVWKGSMFPQKHRPSCMTCTLSPSPRPFLISLRVTNTPKETFTWTLRTIFPCLLAFPL